MTRDDLHFSVHHEDDLGDLIAVSATITGLVTLVSEHRGAWSPTRQGVISARVQDIEHTLKRAADELILVHADTGIDLAEWAPVLALVRLVYPDFTPIREDVRITTEATVAYRRERWGEDGESEYRTPVGRDTFTGAADWKPTR